MAAASGPSSPSPDLALDVSRLMDSVREEVTQLMLEGVQKTASYCASLCAERIVAARREMQRRWAEERRELERLYGIPGAGLSPSGPSGLGLPAPSLQPLPGTGSSPSSLKPPRKEESPLPPFLPGGMACAVGTVRGTSPRTPVQVSPQSAVQSENRMPDANYDSTFIDAYDAVQTLEERNHQAARAMELLDEALQAATAASHGNAAFAARPASGSRPVSAHSGRSAPEVKPPQVWDAVSSHSFASGPAAASSCAAAAKGNGFEMSAPSSQGVVVMQPAQSAVSPMQAQQQSSHRQTLEREQLHHQQSQQNGMETTHESRQASLPERQREMPAPSWTRPSEHPQQSLPVPSNPKAPPVQTFAEPIALPDSRREVNPNGSATRERSVTSMSSGISSLPAADLHGG